MTKLRGALLCLAGLAAASAFAQLDPNRVLIVVNGSSIRAAEYYPRMETLPNMGRMAGDQFVAAAPGFLTLQQLINEELMVQLAREQGVFPTTAEMDAEVKERMAKNPKLLEAFKLLGLGEDAYRRDILVQMCEFKVTTKGVNITDFEVENYYKSNVERIFTVPRIFTLRVITVPDEAAQQRVDTALKSGTPFTDVAKANSTDLSAQNGGYFGRFREDQISEQVRAAVGTLKKGETSAWVINDKLRVKFLLEEVSEKTVMPFDNDLKSQIRRQLMIDKGRARNNIGALMADMRKKARFEFKGTPFDEQIKQAFQGAG